MTSARYQRASGTLAWLWRDEPGALELLVGRERYQHDLARGPAVWNFAVATVVLVVTALVGSSIRGFHPVPLVAFCILGLVGAPIAFIFGPKWPLGVLIALGLVVFTVFVAGVGLAGPRMGEAAVVLPAAMSTTWLWFSRRWAVVFVGLTAVGYAVIVGTQPGYPKPLARWILVIGVVISLNLLLRWIVVRIRGLAEDERRASAEVRRLAVAEGEARRAAEAASAQLEIANNELARWSHTLEAQVAAQVAEIEALTRLRRFLSAQVAEAVLSTGDEAILQPHRRQIAVFFCDLRGFTSFTGGAEPEEVVEALDAYYNVVGTVLRRHNATVGSFAGDGIMAYLNDPVPCEDPAGTAVQMAKELRAPMARFIDIWKRRGYDLGYGVGIAYGYATLGTIGFEGRNDYTALGSVVNLAARLCGEAGSQQVLIDGRACDALGQRFEVVAKQVTLKGFPSPVAAFEVVE